VSLLFDFVVVADQIFLMTSPNNSDMQATTQQSMMGSNSQTTILPQQQPNHRIDHASIVNMDENNDYPQDTVTVTRPPALPDPLLDHSKTIYSDVRDIEGETRASTQNGILVSTGLRQPYSRACGFIFSETSSSSSHSRGQHEIESAGIQRQRNESAYLMCDELSNAIFGTVSYGIVLHRSPIDGIWQWTTEECAIKKMKWERIGTNRQENPKQEIAVMQYLEQYFVGINDGPRVPAATVMLQTGIIMPLDFFYDSEYLYIITPFCSGGEIFQSLQFQKHFTEDQSRYLLIKILNGLEHLQRAGICHLDISMENIMMHEGQTVFIDMGMSLKIPFVHNEEGDANIPRNVDHRDESAHRCLIDSETPAGKPYCKAPENNKGVPFDGHAVDMWPVGVCLFAMLTGIFPWRTARETDEYFRNYSGGYLVEMLTNNPDINLSGDAMCILQRMLWAEPTDRLSLQQVRNHPWINGPTDDPTNDPTNN